LSQFRTEGYGEVAEPDRFALFLELNSPCRSSGRKATAKSPSLTASHFSWN